MPFLEIAITLKGKPNEDMFWIRFRVCFDILTINKFILLMCINKGILYVEYLVAML